MIKPGYRYCTANGRWSFIAEYQEGNRVFGKMMLHGYGVSYNTWYFEDGSASIKGWELKAV